MKIRDNETGEVFEYGENIHHALRISENAGCLTFENLQNGDGSLQSGDGGYSFVLDDGKTPKESNSPDAVNGATYANIGGFNGDNTKNNGWIPVEERLPENNKLVLVWARSTARGADEWSLGSCDKGFWVLGSYGGSLVFPSQLEAVAWRPLPEPYRLERSEGE